MSNKLKYTMFGNDEQGKQFKALFLALIKAAEAEDGNDNEKIYDFLKLPKTSLIVELVQALHSLGYEIKKKEQLSDEEVDEILEEEITEDDYQYTKKGPGY